MHWAAHSTALVESDRIGENTRIWAWTHIMDGAFIGSHCNIGDHCFIEGGARIGDGVTIKNGVCVWDGVTVENFAFIGPNAAFTNDRRPRSRNANWKLVPTLVRVGASVGANATIVCGITVGRYALIGAGSVVTRDVPDHALFLGNPAKFAGFVCRCADPLMLRSDVWMCSECGKQYELEGGDLRIINMEQE